MPKKNLLEDIKREQGRLYRTPGEVMRDRRFGDGERREILLTCRELGPGQNTEIDMALGELAAWLAHAAE